MINYKFIPLSVIGIVGILTLISIIGYHINIYEDYKILQIQSNNQLTNQINNIMNDNVNNKEIISPLISIQRINDTSIIVYYNAPMVKKNIDIFLNNMYVTSLNDVSGNNIILSSHKGDMITIRSNNNIIARQYV